MTAYIETLAGVAPSPLHADYRPWLNDVAASLLAICPLDRDTTYYFSQSGDDTNGIGSQDNPWKTISKAQSTIDAWTHSRGGLRLRFKRGDTWTETTGLTLNKSDITVDAYGSGAAPLWNWFDQTIAASSAAWTNATGDRWTATDSEPGWLRETTRRITKAYRYVTSTGDVESEANSFYWASNTLHVNAGASVDPNDLAWEFTDDGATEDTGVDIAAGATRCRVDGIRFDGWGHTTTNTQEYGVRFLGTGTDVAAITNCESYFASRHNLGHYNATTSGGISLWMNNRFGYVGEAAGSPFISYAAEGDQETICIGNVAAYGALATDDRSIADGRAFNCHTDGGAGETVDYVVFCDSIVDGTAEFTNTNATLVASTATPSASTVGDVRVVEWGTKFLGFGEGTGNLTQYPQYQARVNCECEWKPEANVIEANGTQGGGWFANCYYAFDLARITQNRWAFWNAGASDDIDAKFFHCWVHVIRLASVDFSIDRDNHAGGNQTNLANSEFVNSIMTTNETKSDDDVTVGLLNTAAAYRNNAFYNVDEPGDDSGHSNAANTVQLGTPPTFRGIVPAGSQLVAGEAALLTLDANGTTRAATPTIGPWEADTQLAAIVTSSNARAFEEVALPTTAAGYPAQINLRLGKSGNTQAGVR